LLEGRLPLSEYVLLVSGRGGFEIIQKAIVGGVPWRRFRRRRGWRCGWREKWDSRSLDSCAASGSLSMPGKSVCRWRAPRWWRGSLWIATRENKVSQTMEANTAAVPSSGRALPSRDGWGHRRVCAITGRFLVRRPPFRDGSPHARPHGEQFHCLRAAVCPLLVFRVRRRGGAPTHPHQPHGPRANSRTSPRALSRVFSTPRRVPLDLCGGAV